MEWKNSVNRWDGLFIERLSFCVTHSMLTSGYLLTQTTSLCIVENQRGNGKRGPCHLEKI